MDLRKMVMICAIMVILCSALFNASTCRYGDAPNCGFPCRCKSGTCDPETGACDSQGCGDGDVVPYEGEGCHIGNVAYQKLATQVGTFKGRYANHSVDGNIGPVDQKTCSLPHDTNGNPRRAWWSVDLGSKYTVSRIIIFNRDVFKVRATYIAIKVGKTNTFSEMELCSTYKKQQVGGTTNLECNDTIIGQHVTIRRIDGGSEPHYMNFCEIAVMAYEPIVCEDCDGCDDYKGCETCPAGKGLPDCKKDCSENYWGVNCKYVCGECINGQVCNPTDGVCPGECQEWYLGRTCKLHITSPDLSNNLIAAYQTSGNLVIIWQPQYDVPQELEQFYSYRISYWVDLNDVESLDNPIIHTLENIMTYTLANIAAGDTYTVQITPIRRKPTNETAMGTPSSEKRSGIIDKDSCYFGNSEECGFTCNCESGTCDRILGHCVDKCQLTLPEGNRYTGVGCRIGNVALGKNATQIGTYEEHAASRAVDGDINSNLDRSSCAHPQSGGKNVKAWWMVDLGVKHVVFSVTIYNRNGAKYRTTYFEIRIGMSPIFDNQDLCTTYRDDPQDELTLHCNEGHMEGRYVSFRRIGGKEPNNANFCEFVVTGYECIDTSVSQCDGVYNNYLGCNLCKPGKKLPACKEDCPAGYWGINCKEKCGHCFNGSTCTVINGECEDGCGEWYIDSGADNRCDVFIPRPNLRSVSPKAANVRSDEFVVTWPPAKNIGEGLEKYYQYIVEYKTLGDSTENKTQSPKIEHRNVPMSYHLTGLHYNTEYEVRVIPYRTWNGTVGGSIKQQMMEQPCEEAGDPTIVVTIKTKCIVPSTPMLGNITETDEGWEITYTDSTKLNPGCDSIETYAVYSNKASQLLSVLSKTVTTLDYETYNGSSVWLVVENNEGLKAESNTMFLLTFRSPNPQDRVGDDGSGGTSGSLIGGVIGGVIVLIAILAVAIVLILRTKKSRQSKDVTDATPEAMIDDTVEMAISNLTEMEGNSYDNYLMVKKETGSSPTTILVAHLDTYIAALTNGDPTTFEKEYKSIPVGELHSCAVAELSNNVPKNRFKNIKAYDHSRVVLHPIEDTEQVEYYNAKSNNLDYINANFIKGYRGDDKHYIAAQGPVPHTIVDFWRMIWEHKINRIVVLTKEMENGRRKCEKYWPSVVGQSVQYADMDIELKDVEEYADYVIRVLSCKAEDEILTVRQFHFTSWPDKTALKSAYPLLVFRHKVRKHHSSASGPMLVHCSAGIGRTGTFIAVDYLIEQGLNEDKVDIHKCVLSLRQQRMNMVQVLGQYVYLYNTVNEALAFGETAIPREEIKQTYNSMNSEDAEVPKTTYQFEMICKIEPVTPSVKCNGLEKSNINKNRDYTILPDDQKRPFLHTPHKGSNDYINAVYVDLYSKANAMIATQEPLPDTMVDFWRMVSDSDCSVILSLEDVATDNDTQESIYMNAGTGTEMLFPHSSQSLLTFGPMKIQLGKSYKNSGLEFNELQVENTWKGDDPTTVTFIRLNSWIDKLPEMKDFLTLIEELEKRIETDESSNTLLVKCRDGASRSGILVAAMYIINRMKYDQEIDVVNAVKSVKHSRAQFINSAEQYKFLYEMAVAYQDQFSTYANVL